MSLSRASIDGNPEHDLVSVGATEQRERLSCLPLGCSTIVGLAVACFGVYLANQWSGANEWPVLIVDVGVAIMLVGVLLVLQRSFIRRESDAIIEALTWSEDQITEFRMSDDDRATLMGPEGASSIALDWLADLAAGRIEAAWGNSDESWRICILQSWIWNVTDVSERDSSDRDDLLEGILAQHSGHDMWAQFAEWLRIQFADHHPDEWGASTRRRRVAPDYEVVALFPIGRFKEGFVVRQAAVTLGQHVLMHRASNRWLVANHLAVAPPTPGWPPIWWKVDPPILTDT